MTAGPTKPDPGRDGGSEPVDAPEAPVSGFEEERSDYAAEHPDDPESAPQTDEAAALEGVGIEAYSPEGEPFDPGLHEAMAKQPVDGAASGTVAEVYQRGYRQNGMVLRPARVVVAE